MKLDLRISIGVLFTAIGLILAGYGVFTNHTDIYARSLNINVNLWWGSALTLFGLVMLGAGLSKKRRIKQPLY